MTFPHVGVEVGRIFQGETYVLIESSRDQDSAYPAAISVRSRLRLRHCVGVVRIEIVPV